MIMSIIDHLFLIDVYASIMVLVVTQIAWSIISQFIFIYSLTVRVDDV